MKPTVIVLYFLLGLRSKNATPILPFKCSENFLRIIFNFNRFHQSHRDRLCICFDHRCHYCTAHLERGQVSEVYRNRKLHFCY